MITSHEQLLNLPVGSVIRDADGDVMELIEDEYTEERFFVATKYDIPLSLTSPRMPADILYLPRVY